MKDPWFWHWFLFFFFSLSNDLFCKNQITLKDLKIKTISTERIESLTKKYADFIWQQRCKEGIVGIAKLAGIGATVCALYYPAQKDTTSKEITHDGWGLTWRRIVNDACIAALVTLMLNGINSSLNTIINAFYGSIMNICGMQTLRRFLFELKRYKFITSSLKEENAFISEAEIIIAYNRIILALEHVIAWTRLDCIESKKKNTFAAVISFSTILEEYESHLYLAQKSAWSQDACKKLSMVTHSFLYPWIDLLTPEIPNDS